jgi:hypothetical protein
LANIRERICSVGHHRVRRGGKKIERDKSPSWAVVGRGIYDPSPDGTR